MQDDKNSWDEDYRRRGLLWGGSVRLLPGLFPGARILELGCGDGKSLHAMAGRGWEVVAIDSSPEASTLCRDRTGGETCDRVIIADARACPFRDASFDVIFATHVIGHLPFSGRLRISREIHRLLRAPGTLYFADFSDRDFRYGTGTETEPGTFRRGTGIITHYFTVEETTGLFSQFTARSITEHPWSMRVRGKDLKRSEIQGEFSKQSPG